MTAFPRLSIEDGQGPVYARIRDQVAALVDAGVLRPGDRLPTVRALAADLDVAVNTVAKAYRELEAAGTVVTRERSGTTVAGAGAERELRAGATELVNRARALGLSDDELVGLVRAAQRS